MCSTCKKNILGCVVSEYSFQISPKYYPDKDTISIGDTLWFEFNSPDSFADNISGKVVNYANADNLGFYMGFAELVGTNPVQYDGVVSKFSFKLISGMQVPNRLPITDTIEKSFLIKDIGGRYWFKMGIVPNSIGTFRFNLGNPVGVTKNGNSCPKADFTMNITQTNQHYYMDPTGTAPPSGGPGYFFYVR